MLYSIEKKIISLIILLIKIYKGIISPLLGNRCCYYPSCSEYTCQTLLKHGLLKGAYRSIKRIVSCHPYSTGGVEEI